MFKDNVFYAKRDLKKTVFDNSDFFCIQNKNLNLRVELKPLL